MMATLPTATLNAAAAQSPVAERLYYTSPELEFEARVTEIRLQSQTLAEDGTREQIWQVALDRTAFYPEGGGQPWDTGVLIATARSGATLEIPVERVEEDEAGEVWHFVRKPLNEGTEITGRVDAERRIDHEQQHSGQHLLSAVFFRECGARTVGFHLGAQSSTIDLALPENTPLLSVADVARAEEAANRIIYEQRPMTPHWVDRDYAEEMLRRGDLRKLPDRPGRMRIVQMHGIEFNACGGTHVSNTGAIGSITIRRVEKHKRGQRVEFVCGLRSIRAARADYALLDLIARSLSVAPGDIPTRLEKLLEERKASAKEIKKLTAELHSHQRPSAPGNTPAR